MEPANQPVSELMTGQHLFGREEIDAGRSRVRLVGDKMAMDSRLWSLLRKAALT